MTAPNFPQHSDPTAVLPQNGGGQYFDQPVPNQQFAPQQGFQQPQAAWSAVPQQAAWPHAAPQAPQPMNAVYAPAPSALPASTGKGVAITAAVLAFVGAARALISVAQLVSAGASMNVMVFVIAVLGGALAVGGGLLIARKAAGRWMVVGASAATLLMSAYGFVVAQQALSSIPDQYRDSVHNAGFTTGMLIGILLTIATLVLASLPATGRWVARR